MLWTIAIILLLMWALGMVTSYTLYGFIHLLLLLALATVLIRVIQGRVHWTEPCTRGAARAGWVSGS